MYPGGGPHDDVGHNIRNEQRHHGVDKNPKIPCDACGDGYPWRGYWMPRVNNMDNPSEEDWLCDICIRNKRGRERKLRNLKKLSEWAK